MTPTQRVKCDLLGVVVEKWFSGSMRDTEHEADGWYVTRGPVDTNPSFVPYSVLCIPTADPAMVGWPTKKFNTIDEAIEAAAAPAKHGLAWDN